MSLIYKKIIEVMQKVDAIGKENINKGQGFKFRGVDDVYNSFHTYFKECGVFSIPEVLDERSEERVTKSGSVSIYRILKIKYSFYAEDGSSVSAIVIGEGMDSGDKASNKAMSVAHKYAILQVFCVPTEEQKDPDAESHQVLPRGAAPAPIPKYDATNEQHRNYFKALIAKHHKPVENIKEISDSLIGEPMDRLDYLVQHYKTPIVEGL